MTMFTTSDNIALFYKDWGNKDAQPIVFHHGWPLSAEMLRQLDQLVPLRRSDLAAIDHETIGGNALWLRAEPDEDPAQADALAAVLAMALAA